MTQEEKNPLHLILEDFKLHLVSSGEFARKESIELAEQSTLRFAEESTDHQSEKLDKLEVEQLPPLPMKNRAQLQIQSPYRARFYWSLRSNPFEILKKMLGDEAVKYKLVAKLINQTENREFLFPIEIAGSTWFDVEADSMYHVEIGLFAPDKPFIRLLFSNTVQTPRSKPSPFVDWSPEFLVSNEEFVEILDATGFKHDATELALAADDPEDTAIKNTFFSLFGHHSFPFKISELRYALFALASGLSLEDLRGHISAALFDFLQRLITEHEVSSEKIRSKLSENFIISDESDEYNESDKVIYRTFGASLIEFHRKKPFRKYPKLSPISSLRR